MGALAREPDGTGQSNEGPMMDRRMTGHRRMLLQRERLPEQDQNLNNAPPSLDAEPPWRQKGQPGRLLAEVRSRLGLTPEPPAPDKPARIFDAKGRSIVVIALTGAGVAGYMWSSAPPATAPELSAAVGVAERAMPVPAAPPEPPRAGTPLRRLTVVAVRHWETDDPVPLTISSSDAGSNVSVVIGGLAPGSA